MNALELRAALSLASIFALRMLGLFAIHARTLPGFDAAMVGWVLGIYGLTQGVLQVPFGMASDRFGRKPVIRLRPGADGDVRGGAHRPGSNPAAWRQDRIGRYTCRPWCRASRRLRPGTPRSVYTIRRRRLDWRQVAFSVEYW